MLKYSIIGLAAAVAIFSVGCDTSSCCQVGRNDGNVAPVVSRVLGLSNNGTKTCVPGSSVSLQADASDKNSDLDSSSYEWIERVGNNVNNLNKASILCPADGKSTKVCATVKDKEGLKSNEVCVNLEGRSKPVTPKPVASNCNPHITITDENGGAVSSVVAGNAYKFNNNVNSTDCPNAQCTWSVKSHRAGTNQFFTCLTKNSHDGVDDKPGDNGLSGNQYHVNLDGSGNEAKIDVHTCASLYDYFEVTLDCTNPTYNETKKYNLQQPTGK